MIQRCLSAFAFLAMFIIGTTPQLSAQAVYGSVVGTVTDSSGAAVPSAKVTVTDIEKSVANAATVNDSGNYLQRQLIPGRYRIRVEAAGFKAYQQDATVSADTEVRVDAKLEVGDITQTVEVTAEAGVLKTERSDVASTYSATTIAAMPLMARRFTQLQLYTPGNAVAANNQSFNGEFAGGQPFNITLGGQRSQGSGYMLDGTDHHSALVGIIIFQPTLESLTEAKVTTNSYDAEIGNASASVVSAQTKSGTNEMHGSAFEFLRNSNQQARNPFSQSTPVPNSDRTILVSQWNQFGGSLGGAIKKNKLFYYGDYQGQLRRIGGTSIVRVPTQAERNGDFRGLGTNRRIFDPLTGDGTLATRREFIGQVIPASRLSPQARNLMALIPLPNIPNITGENPNYAGSGKISDDQHQYNVRGDYYVTEKLHMFGRYSIANFDLDAPGIYGKAGGTGFSPTGGSGATPAQAINRHISIAAGADYVVSPSLFTDFRFGFFRYHVFQTPNSAGTNGAQAAGIPGLNIDEASNDMPVFRILDYANSLFSFGDGQQATGGCNCPMYENEKQVQIVNNWTKVSGNHTTKFGADVRRAFNMRSASDRHRSGQLDFNAARTQGPLTATTTGGGTGMASFMLGDVFQMQRFVGGSLADNARERQNRMFFFVQDTWKVNRKLTLNYGIRWEIYKPQTVNLPGKGGDVSLDTGEVQTYGVGNSWKPGGGTSNMSGNVQADYKLLAPRVGLAYQLDSKTVIRAGFGRGFSMGAFGTVFGHNITQNLPVLASQNLVAPRNFDAAFTLASGPGATPIPSTVLNGRPLGPNGLPILPNGTTMFVLRPKLRLPTVDSWNFSIQRQLTNTSAFEVAYVASKGTRMVPVNAYDVNQASIVGFGTLNTNQRKPYFNQACAACPGGTLGWTQNMRYFGVDATTGYQSLQIKYEKRFSRGLQVTSHFTYSKGYEYAVEYYARDAGIARGLTEGNRPKALFLSANYELPFGKGKKIGSNWNKVLDTIAGGWQTNYVWQWYSGLPMTPAYQNCGADQDVGICRPNLVAEPQTGERTRDAWYTVSPVTLTSNGQISGPWQRPQRGQLGNAGRGYQMFGPEFQQLDVSIFKTFKLTEKYRLQARGEIFNLANYVTLNFPNLTVDQPNVAGRITSTAAYHTPRLAQFALRLDF